MKFDGAWSQYPAARYAALSAEGCNKELVQRGIAFTAAPGSAGVLAPVRIPKGVGGVVFRTDAPDHARAKNPFEVFDCRLVLALDDFAKVLVAHEIDEARIFSAWRPTTGVQTPATRHPGGLAVDIARLGKKPVAGETEHRWLVVERDFHGQRGTAPCGTGAPKVVDLPDARELRAILCDAVDKHLFTVVLTPNYDHAHRNHLHLEVTPDVAWTLLR